MKRKSIDAHDERPDPVPLAPTTAELTELTHTLAERVGRFLQRQGLLECDGEHSYLAEEAV